jgi:hypothetical protein
MKASLQSGRHREYVVDAIRIMRKESPQMWHTIEWQPEWGGVEGLVLERWPNSLWIHEISRRVAIADGYQNQ